MSNFKPYDYQDNNSDILVDKINTLGFYFFAGEMRTGKTITSLLMAEKLNCSKVLFVTKKKPIPGVLKDFKLVGCKFMLDVINYQSIHKINALDYDLIVLDESQFISSFPKPSVYCKKIRDLIKKNKQSKVLFMSGTFCPESYSQLYHQFYVLRNKPEFFKESTFYKWFKVYGIDKKKYINGFEMKDYKNVIDKVSEVFKSDYCYSFSQDEAGFKSKVNEIIHDVKLKDNTYKLINRLVEDSVIVGDNDSILADTGAKLKQKLHQMYSGTIKLDSGKRFILDKSKAEYIAEVFKGKKIAILYKFVAEGIVLKQVLEDNVTDDLEVFNTTNKSYVGQVVSNREGVNLSKATDLVMYNIDYSATSYWQGKERISSKDRKVTNLHWIFSNKGLEYDVYEVVKSKKDYTLNIFKKKFGR